MSSLRNDWKEETYYLFENTRCWWCNKYTNEQGHRVDCLHHILGRKSNSPLNAAPLHNFSCHLGNGKLSHQEIKKRFLAKTLGYLMSNDYSLTEKDSDFLDEHSDLYKPSK